MVIIFSEALYVDAAPSVLTNELDMNVSKNYYVINFSS